jgi:hypothetical protein
MPPDRWHAESQLSHGRFLSDSLQFTIHEPSSVVDSAVKHPLRKAVQFGSRSLTSRRKASSSSSSSSVSQARNQHQAGKNKNVKVN